MTTTHQHNGRVPTAGPLEAAAKAERRLISQMDELSKRLDGLATTDLAAAQERLAEAAANLAERVEAAKTFVDATIARVGNLLDGLADLFSDDVTKADEVTPSVRPLTPGELEAVAQAPWWDADKAVHDDVANEYNHRHGESHTTGGPPDDEDDPNDDLDDDTDDDLCPKAAEMPRVTEEDFDADNYLPPATQEAFVGAIRSGETAFEKQDGDSISNALNGLKQDASAPKKPARRRGRKT